MKIFNTGLCVLIFASVLYTSNKNNLRKILTNNYCVDENSIIYGTGWAPDGNYQEKLSDSEEIFLAG